MTKAAITLVQWAKSIHHCKIWRLTLNTFIVFLGLSLASLSQSDDRVITSHGVSAFGDLKYDEGFSSFDYVNPEAPQGGEMSVWAFGTFDSLNPFIVKGNGLVHLGLTFDSLLKKSADETDAYYGLIAESVTYPSPSRKWAIFDIREEVWFSDGRPVTAEDVVFSFDMLSTQGSPQYRSSLEDIEKAEMLGERRVKFTFKDGRPTRDLVLAAGGMPIFSKASFTDRAFNESSMEPIIASGPYRVEKAEPGQFAIYRRRDNYWGDDLPVNKGHHNFDSIKVVYYKDYTAGFEGFKGGDYDFREEFYSKLWTTGYDFPEIRKGLMIKETVPDNNPSGAQGYWMNLRRDKFADPKVRQAFNLAFNFEWSNKTLFYDAYIRTDSFWENSNLQAEGLPGEDELSLLEPLRGEIPETVFTETAYSPPMSDPNKLGDRNMLQKASRLLDEAGWNLKDGFRYNDAGEKLTVVFLSSSPSSERIFNPYTENLKAIGIDASVRSVDPAQIKKLVDDYDFDVISRRYSFSQTPGQELRSIFGSVSADQPGSYNISGVQNSGVDALIGAIESAQSRDELVTAVRALDRVLRALHIWVPSWYSASYRIAYRNQYARPATLPLYDLGELSIWWEDKSQTAR